MTAFSEWERAAGQVKPSARQLNWLRDPFYAFVHFSPNTYTGKEWGDGTEDPAIFDPTELDCDGWVEAIKSAGMTGLVLTAKHHDGFCLWPSQHTEHSVKNSPWRGGKGDVVKEAAEACRRGGIRFGFYLSPWDRNSKAYGTDAYNDYYKAQLTELLTGYGEIFHVWFDGACGEGENGRRQAYDFEGYVSLIRKYQPNATIFNDHGPDVRWIGNEAGQTRQAEWSVVPGELCTLAEKQTNGALACGDLSGIQNQWERLGDTCIAKYSQGLCFCPAEADMSIRDGWFYHENEAPHALERLFNTYLGTVGNGAGFNLNIPPMPSGRFDPRDVNRLRELGQAIKDAFGSPVSGARIEKASPTLYRVTLPDKTSLRYIELSEAIEQGQRVESFALMQKGELGTFPLRQGATIGSRRILELGGETLQSFELHILASRGEPQDIGIKVYR